MPLIDGETIKKESLELQQKSGTPPVASYTVARALMHWHMVTGSSE